jgi:hypothetical protein
VSDNEIVTSILILFVLYTASFIKYDVILNNFSNAYNFFIRPIQLLPNRCAAGFTSNYGITPRGFT